MIKTTMAWHDAVATAKAERFGEQSFVLRVQLAAGLIREETTELLDELVEWDGTIKKNISREAAAKEAADVFFVVLQAMHVLGLTPEQFQAAYATVVRSNYSKLDNGVATFRDDGKLTKGPAYSPANVERALREVE